MTTSTKAHKLSLKLETIRKNLELELARYSQTNDDTISEALDSMEDALDKVQEAIDILDGNTEDELEHDMDVQRLLNRAE